MDGAARPAVLRGPVLAAGLGSAAALAVLLAPAATAAPPPGGECAPGWRVATVVLNPDGLGFFERLTRNDHAVVCVRNWTGPDPDPDIGFLVIDNVVRLR